MRFRFMLMGLLLLASCSRRARVLLPGTQYRIANLGDHGLTLPPPVANLSTDKALTLNFAVALGPSKKDCVESNDLFSIRIDRKSRQLALTMPSLIAWQSILPQWEQPDNREIEQKIEAILNAPETLESRGCLSIGSAIQLRQILRDAIPMRPGFDLYTAYGYRAGGLGLDLKPGVRLKVQRAHFNSPLPVNGRRSILDLIGTSTVYYECRLDRRDRIAFTKPSVEYDSDKVKEALAKGWEDTSFARLARPQPVYRLFFLTSFLKKGVRRSALVLGAPSVARMQAMERQIAANPAIGCEELGGGSCISFDGDVSVSAEVQVTINGHPTYLDWGSNVRTVLRKLRAEKATDLHLRRAFQGKLVPVDIDPKVEGALESTSLVAGDELSWHLY